MNSKKAKGLRSLAKHLVQQDREREQQEFAVYGRQQKYAEVSVPDPDAPSVYDEAGNVKMVMRKELVATGSIMLDPACGRSVYKKMKKGYRS